MNKKDVKRTQNNKKINKNNKKSQKITNMEEIMLFLWYFCMYKCGYTNTRGYTAYKSMKYKIQRCKLTKPKWGAIYLRRDI